MRICRKMTDYRVKLSNGEGNYSGPGQAILPSQSSELNRSLRN